MIAFMNINTTALKDIRKIELSLSTSDSADYTDGCINVNIQARKGSLIKEGRFSCFVYTDDYSPMCNSDASNKFNRESSINVSITMLSFRIWLPGKYFLLLRDKNDGALARIDFEIDKAMNILQQPLKMQAICSIEDILTTSVENTESAWDVLSTTPGTSELRQYALESRRLKIYNEFRKVKDGDHHFFMNHEGELFLIETPSPYKPDPMRRFDFAYGKYFRAVSPMCDIEA